MPAETASDKAAQLPAGQINSDQRQRSGQPTRRAGLRRVRRAVGGPNPNSRFWSRSRSRISSNLAGGAVELQHLAYVIQWFLFAALALARADRHGPRRTPAGQPELDDEAPITPADANAAGSQTGTTGAPRTDGNLRASPLARSQFLDRLPATLVGHVPSRRAVHLAEPHDPIDIDEEGAAAGEASVIVEHPVRLRHGATRPEVGEQRNS